MKPIRYSKKWLLSVLVIVVISMVGLVMLWRGWIRCPKLCYGTQHLYDVGHDLTDLASPESPKQFTPVYVIEEHHEALLYWYDAVKSGLIREQGNVLFHIDGHSDGATPPMRDILPMFRMPRSKDEIYTMMQKNDIFVIAAALTGLISRFIWVWPPWDPQMSENFDGHFVYPTGIGKVWRKDLDGKTIEDACACIYSEEDIEDTSCFMMNITSENYADMPREEEIDPQRCRIVYDNALIEIVSENKAVELMESGEWISPLESVILDIDEDYYGTEAAVQPLYDVGIKEGKIVWLKFAVGKLFCPTKPREEHQADMFYARLIDKIIDLNRFCTDKKEKTGICKSSESRQVYMFMRTKEMLQEITDRGLYNALCKSEKGAQKVLRSLIKQLMVFNTKQLKMLKEIGICFNLSPRTYLSSPGDGMRTCDGFNRPNDSIVPFHVPTSHEVIYRSSQIKRMLTSDNLNPGVITVCRSTRDGYTPRKYFREIERGVLNILKTTFDSVEDSSIFYDPYLLGGILGWQGRH